MSDILIFIAGVVFGYLTSWYFAHLSDLSLSKIARELKDTAKRSSQAIDTMHKEVIVLSYVIESTNLFIVTRDESGYPTKITPVHGEAVLKSHSTMAASGSITPPVEPEKHGA
jgi:hypothetical protein